MLFQSGLAAEQVAAVSATEISPLLMNRSHMGKHLGGDAKALVANLAIKKFQFEVHNVKVVPHVFPVGKWS